MKNIFTTALFLFSAMSFGQIPTNGLLLHYKFDGNLNDASGNNRNASANGTANYVSDFEGNSNSAIDFGNAINYITANNTKSLPLHGNTDWSMSFYYHCEDGEEVVLFSKKPPSSKTLAFAFALRGYNHNDSLNFTTGIDSYIQGGWAGSLGAYSTKTKKDLWNHLTLVKKGDSIYTYSNGSVVDAKKFAWLDRNSGTSHDINIGQSWIVGNKFDGLLDDFAIHNRALTEQEINALGERITGKTCYQTVNDTTHVTIYDTVKVAVHDTLIIKTTILGSNNSQKTHITKVYPNPAKDFVNFDFGNYTELNGYYVKIINTQSQEVYLRKVTQQNESIELSSLGSNGLYFIQVYNQLGELVEVRKLLIE